MSMKKSNDTIGNRTRDLPTCSAELQPTAPPRMICATAYHGYPYAFDNISRAMTLQEPIAISCIIRCPTVQNELRYFQHLSQLQIQDDRSLMCELPRSDAAINTIKLTAHVPTFCFNYIEDGGGLLANLREILKSV
jgi:hypothetical protein